MRAVVIITVLFALLLAVVPSAPAAPMLGGSTIFEISGGGSILHYHNPATTKPSFKNKANKKNIPLCIMGTAGGCSDNNTVDADPAGKGYLFYDSTTAWRLATNPDGDEAIMLTGYVSNDGRFTMIGTDALSMTQVAVIGKVKFDKATGDPAKVNGKVFAVSAGQEHAGKGNFKTVAIVPAP